MVDAGRAAVIVALNDLRLLVRRRTDAFFVFLFPALFAVFFAQVVSGGGGRPVPVVVVAEGEGPSTRALAEALRTDPGLKAVQAALPEAVDRVRRGKAAAYVLLRGGGAPIELGVDPARRGEAGLLHGVVLRRAAEAAAARAGAPRAALAGVQVVERSVEASLRPVTPAGVSVPQGLAWGLIACAATFGSALSSERARGTLVRLRAASMTPWQVLAAKGLACFLAAVVTSVLLLLLAGLVFGLWPRSWGLLLPLASAAACFTGLMMLVATIGGSSEASNRAGWAVLLVLAMLGGAMVPSYLAPAWLESVSVASPIRWTILAFEGALWRGFSTRELLAPCGILLGIGAVSFVAGALLFRWR